MRPDWLAPKKERARRMRSPFVSRAYHSAILGQVEQSARHFEQACAEAQREARETRTLLVAEIQAERSRYADLLVRYSQMKLSGAIEVPIATAPAPAKEPDMIMQAINDVCRGKPPAVKRAMVRQMREDRANDVPDMDILIRIQQGEPNEGVPT